tara:strand:- start:153 stop:755 length:603 start_codon:yes stop_codon:yes gene_type:complete
MARIAINTGTTADDGTGDPIRTAFTSVNTMTTEIYADDFVTTARIADDAITSALIADDAVTSALIADNAITNALMADDAIDHAELANRYTAKATSSATGSQNLDASAATTFLLTGNVATATLTIQNMKLGQVIDIHMTGTLSSAAITLATNFSSTTINKIGTTDFDTSEKNLIQVVCVDDTDGAAIINYSVGKITTDTTP